MGFVIANHRHPVSCHGMDFRLALLAWGSQPMEEPGLLVVGQGKAMFSLPPEGHPLKRMDAQNRNFRLLAMQADWAVQLGEGLARIDPWLRLTYSSQTLSRYLSAEGQDRQALAVLADGTPAACMTVRPNWLRGPLLELLAVLPGYQGCGLGRDMLAWLVGQAQRDKQGNLWTISSEFNQSARAFYRQQGFEEVGNLPDLILAQEVEILLRLRINQA